MANKDETFLNAVKDVNPLKVKSKTIDVSVKKPKPIPKKLIEDEKKVLIDSLSDEYISPEFDFDENTSYLRNGHSPDIVKKLKKGFWAVQGTIDLHGLVSEEAKEYVVNFIHECKRKKVRCIRIIHGKGYGSGLEGPKLKSFVDQYLQYNPNVLAYHSAIQKDGGTGAVYVQLKNIN